MVDDTNYQLKKTFRVAEDLILIAMKNEIQDPATFVKANFHSSKDVSGLQEIENKVYKNGVPKPGSLLPNCSIR